MEKRRSCSRPQENWRNSTAEILEVEKGIWKGRIREDANKKGLGSCYRSQRDVQTQERKNLSFIQE